MTAREAEIQWRWFWMSFFRHSGQFRSFGALFGHFWPLLANLGLKHKIVVNWSCDHSKRPQEKQKSNGDGFWWKFQGVQVTSGHFGATKSHFWAQTQNCHKLVLWHLKMIARGADIWWRWFQKSLWTCWGHLGQFWGHFRAILGPFQANLWPQTQNCCRLVMWPLKTTARGAEL